MADMDADLRSLTPETLAVVRRYLEDRLINAVTALDIRLQMQMPGTMAADVVYQEARRTIARILEIVEEVRALAKCQAPSA